MRYENKNNWNLDSLFPSYIKSMNNLFLVINSKKDYEIKLIKDGIFLKKLGYSFKSLIRTSFLDLIHADDVKKFISHFENHINIYSNHPLEIQILAREGKVFWVTVDILKSEEDDKEELLLIITNISKQKDLEFQLKKTKQNLEDIAKIVPNRKARKFKTGQIKLQVPVDDLLSTEQKLQESEEKFRTITEESLMGIGIIQDDQFKYVNERLAEIFGYTKEELKNLPPHGYSILFHKESFDLVLEQTKRKQAGLSEVINHYNWKGIKKSGESIWLESFSKTVTYKKRFADFVTLFDITEKKEIEDRLKESEAKYHLLFDNLTSAFAFHKIILDEKDQPIDYEFLEANPAFEKQTGLKISEIIGKRVTEVLPGIENDPANWINKYGEVALNRTPINFESYAKPLDQWFHVLAYSPKKGWFATIFTNITKLKKVEKALMESENRYRSLIETSSIGVMEIDVINNKISFINSTLLKILGYKEEELIGIQIRDKIIHSQDLVKLLASHEEREIEFRIFDKLGNLKWLSGRRIPQFDKSGNFLNVRFWLDEITEKKMYEELIIELNINFLNFTEDSRNNIELLINTCKKLLNGNLILYAHKKKTEQSESYEILTSDNQTFIYDTTEFTKNLFLNEFFLEGHDFPQTFLDIHKKKYAQTDPFIKNLNIKGCFGKIIKTHDASESLLCVYYKDNPIITGQNKLVLFLICDAIEIEQRRWQVQQDLEKQNLSLDKINKLKTELFSRTSHELKTPLISIKGFTELLLTLHKNKLDSELISIIEEIRDGGARLEKIINLLLEGTKLGADQLELDKNQEDLAFLVKFCVSELKGLATLRNQSIYTDLHKKLPAMFDKERVYEVISNLLLNAIKYTQPGGEISIKSEIIDDYYIISVKDNGIGFTKEEKNQAFTQFGKIERYGQGWDVAIEGTGLGLYITKKLVELHSGKIWLESDGRNRGTTFSFSLPRT